ncbi:hypothetical protein [Micromonospora sp. RTP1Z1]|uniref:hypothetical protein n=1 Tax=Micromonospora sp. RTP1Z1 TaxID=2994043 RepID=UPI0029C81333|nr:hypothetical protein [Micromonospora sp. RTP1Z1]
MTVTADDLDAAVSTLDAALGPATGADWSLPAGPLEWDCWHTAEHLGDTLLSYAAQLVARPDGRYARFAAVADRDASAGEVLEFSDAAGRLLALVVRATPSNVRAFHPSGRADPEGFAAMGCVETLLHGEDIARGLGVALDPSRPLCARVVARLFPDVAAGLADVDPWAALRWCAGRVELPGRPHRDRWQWRGAPIGG